MQKSLSIIIPAYNETRHIKACLDAIAAQTVMPDEVILVDNNSIDRTVEIASSYPFVTIVNESMQGIAYARNRGFNATKADIIGRIDADSILPIDWVARIKAFYADSYHFDHYAYTGGGYFYNKPLPNLNSWLQSQFAFRANRFIMGHYILFGSNMAMPRHIWEDVRSDMCLRTDIHEDLDLSIHLHRHEYKITYYADLVVGIEMRRVGPERRIALHDNLMWWPRTLRVHGNRRWVYGWIGAEFLYYGAIALPWIDWVAAKFAAGSSLRQRLAKVYASLVYVED